MAAIRTGPKKPTEFDDLPMAHHVLNYPQQRVELPEGAVNDGQ